MEESQRRHPDHDELIEPIKGGFAGAGRPARLATPSSRAGARRGGRLLAGVALAALVVVAGAVVFVLPGWVERREAAPRPAPVESEAAVAIEAAEPQLSPEQLERLREQAEGLLAELLSQQARLDGLSAESWGGERWAEYEATARAGDDAYLADAFQDAVPLYSEALAIGEALLGRSADIIAAALQAGATALEAGNATVAQEQFSLVLGIEPEHETAQRGLERAQRLPDVLNLVKRGETHEREDELEEAAAAYREALSIDPGWIQARTALTRVEERIRTRRFETLMSAGFAALASEDYDDAHEHFAAALALRPSSEEAQNGRLQAEQGMRLDQIALIEARAAAFERRELWTQAIEQYEAAIETDPTLVFAQQGLERARYRADLDSKLRYLLGSPNLLFDDTVLADANGLLVDANAIADPGPRLAEQASELARLVRLASMPVAIELRSDEMTEVTVYRVGSLGTFAARTLELRPGTYTAVGSRDGYRDVRETFTVLPGRTLEPIRVECIEPI